jgi:hypothetical protein
MSVDLLLGGVGSVGFLIGTLWGVFSYRLAQKAYSAE